MMLRHVDAQAQHLWKYNVKMQVLHNMDNIA